MQYRLKPLIELSGRDSDKDFWLTRDVISYHSIRATVTPGSHTFHPSSFSGGSTMRSETGASSKIDLAAAKSSIFRVAVVDKSER